MNGSLFYIADDLDDLDEGSTWLADALEREAGELLAKHAGFLDFLTGRGE